MFGWFKKESAVERALRLADDKLASLDYDGAEEMLKPIAAESSEAVSILAKIYSGKTQDYEKLLDNYDKMLELEQYVNSDNISDYTKNMRILFRRLEQKANHLYHKGEISAASLITSRLAAHKNDIGNIEGKSYSMPQGNDAHAENNYAPSENTMHHPKIAMHHLKIAMHHPKIAMHHPKIAMHHLKIAMRHLKIAMRHPKIAMPQSKITILPPRKVMPL